MGLPVFLKKCPWDSYFENPSENPAFEITNSFVVPFHIQPVSVADKLEAFQNTQ